VLDKTKKKILKNYEKIERKNSHRKKRERKKRGYEIEEDAMQRTE